MGILYGTINNLSLKQVGLLNKIQQAKQNGKKLLAVLIDPDKFEKNKHSPLIAGLKETPPDVLLVGGSLLSGYLDDTVAFLKQRLSIPVFLFPGNVIQISPVADGILFMSLISGRNPDFLIGQQVVAAPLLEKTNLEIISTGYLLLENGKTTSVEYMSNTKPIPQEKEDIILATALAGQYLGQQLIYLETGSGANHTVSQHLINLLSKKLQIPIITGGGIRHPEDLKTIFTAGADMAVVGTILEEKPEMLPALIDVLKSY